ncbi:hypothetical protein SAMN05443252_106321 [Bacillus sp. OV322]|uniref:hypothetical protein n=1 Tax=Bacillus sp. OV322 TaxID=1882764 RepID=UPI0008F37492|nr:hypothetical protein [Bacillus sp. OV322]SFC81607.1 hypothetical protein SAMN05443252_106321 [Bacillus sp. OV322]
MSKDHIKTMLETLKQYHECQISLTFNDDGQQPLLSVCYKTSCYELTYIKTLKIESYNNIESTISAIEAAIQNSKKETSI